MESCAIRKNRSTRTVIEVSLSSLNNHSNSSHTTLPVAQTTPAKHPFTTQLATRLGITWLLLSLSLLASVALVLVPPPNTQMAYAHHQNVQFCTTNTVQQGTGSVRKSSPSRSPPSAFYNSKWGRDEAAGRHHVTDVVAYVVPTAKQTQRSAPKGSLVDSVQTSPSGQQLPASKPPVESHSSSPAKWAWNTTRSHLPASSARPNTYLLSPPSPPSSFR